MPQEAARRGGGHLPSGVGKDDALGDSQCLVQIAQGVQLVVLLLDIDIGLLDTLEGQLITLDQNPDLKAHSRLRKGQSQYA